MYDISQLFFFFFSWKFQSFKYVGTLACLIPIFFFPLLGLERKRRVCLEGKPDTTCWFMLHIQNLKRLIDTEWDCYLMVSTLSFFKIYSIPVFCVFFFCSQGYVTLYCAHIHLIIILCIRYTAVWESTCCKTCILMLHLSFLFT